MDSWQPTASIEILKKRAKIIQAIRQFFDSRDVLEVETPLMCHHTVTDPYIHSIKTANNFYLQTSPEYAMKRLLADNSGPIYQICKAFRAEESGRYHNSEFTMLEWYRPGFNHHDLMQEMEELLQALLPLQSAQYFSYAEIFEKYLKLNPHTADLQTLKDCAPEQGIAIPTAIDETNRDVFLQLLMSDSIEPRFENDRATFIYDYPVSQAALAKIRDTNPPVAERFEVYIGSTELANGFHELLDEKTQRERFEKDNMKREKLRSDVITINEYFLSALAHGLPSCAGVALGIDRLAMIICKANAIEEVMAFPINKA